LGINPTTGVIAGTINSGAAAAGPFTSTIGATDGSYSAFRTVAWGISAPGLGFPSASALYIAALDFNPDKLDDNTVKETPNGVIITIKLKLPGGAAPAPIAKLHVTVSEQVKVGNELLGPAKVEAKLTIDKDFVKDIPTLASMYDKVDRFNFYQYGVVKSGFTTVFNKNGKTLGPAFIDPPSGGVYIKSGADKKLMLAQWADDLPWYFDEKKPPEDAKNYDPNLFSISNQLTNDKTTLSYVDTPNLGPGQANEAVFYTWVVGVDKNGKLVNWLPGFSWNWTSDANNETNIKFLGALKPLTGDQLTQGYTNALTNFGK